MKNQTQPLRILVTGGGTSGHISPALAVIQTIKQIAAEDNIPVQFLYVGGKRGFEKDIIQAAGLDFVGVETGKLRRYFSVENFIDQFRLPVGLAQARGVVKKFKPHVVLSTGGYVAVPPVIAARSYGVPVLIHEQTVQIGLANRITARFATRIALSFASAAEELTAAQREKSFVTGNPIRPVIFGGDKEEGKKFCGFADADDHLPTVYVTGGSQGSQLINHAVKSILPQLLQSCRVIHQCGRQPASQEQDFDRLQKAQKELPAELQSRFFVTRFVNDEIKHVFALTDLVIGRSGAGTVAELCVLGKPAIYVPLVPTGGDEQTRNAQMCEREGAAAIIRQADLTGPALLEKVQALLQDRAGLTKMGEAALTLAKPNAARELANAVLELGRSRLTDS